MSYIVKRALGGVVEDQTQKQTQKTQKTRSILSSTQLNHLIRRNEKGREHSKTVQFLQN